MILYMDTRNLLYIVVAVITFILIYKLYWRFIREVDALHVQDAAAEYDEE